MLILFALGAMSLVWMALIASLIFAEKVLPFGGRLPATLALCFIVLGAWVAAAPGSVPGLTQPGEVPAMQMHR
jgi:predicted metal-binding membrane protein